MARAGYCRHNREIDSSIPCWECEAERVEREKQIKDQAEESARNRFIDGLRSFADGTEEIDNMTREEIDAALRKEGIDPERLAQKTRLVLQLIKMDPRWNEEAPHE